MTAEKPTFLEFMRGLTQDPLLSKTAPAKKKEAPSDPAIQNFLEIADFYRAHDRLPQLNVDLNERKLAKRLRAYQTRLRAKVKPYDDVGVLAAADRASIVVPRPQTESNPVLKSFSDVLRSDPCGLLSGMDTDIYRIQHVPAAPKNMPEEIAERKPCRDFSVFEKSFADIQTLIDTGHAKVTRFTSEVQVDVGWFYILHGLLCYVAKVVDERTEEIQKQVSDRENPRLRVIFANGTEINILKRSLARALYKDKLGKIVTPDEDVHFSLKSGQTVTSKDIETGCVYILSSRTKAPALAAMQQRGCLHKIGFSTRPVAERIKDAAHDPTYLEAPVVLEANIRCFNLNPHKVEHLIHAFLVNQRVVMTLYTKKGEPYQPKEWFNVDLETALAVCKHIVAGDIMQYRMDNTTGKLKTLRDSQGTGTT